MNIPKVKFINIPMSLEIDWIHGFLFENNWGWGRKIIRKHPELEKIYSFKTEEEQVKFLKQYITKYKKENKILIDKNIFAYIKAWQNVEKEFFTVLSDILHTDWPQDKKNIRAMVSINPICPRFLDEWSFSIFCNNKIISHALDIIMHESCHFLYFEKWKKLYPKMSHKKFESPYIEWHLSEIVAPIILNDKRIQKLLKQKAFFYEEHERIKIGRKTAPQYFTELYSGSSNFTEFLLVAYKVIRANRELFNVMRK